MKEKFENFKEEFKDLKKQFKQKKISEREFKSRLKRLQLKDNDGCYWTIGAQTGQWYYFDGKKWVTDHPPSLRDKKAVCIYCGAENDLETEICIKCNGSLQSEKAQKHKADKFEEALNRQMDEGDDLESGTSELYEVRSIGAFSFLLFLGGVGLIVGMVLGVFTGATNYLPGLQKLTPSFIRGLQGGLARGLVFSLYGGVAGFSFLGVTGLLLAFLSNLIFSLFGGIKIRLSRSE